MPLHTAVATPRTPNMSLRGTAHVALLRAALVASLVSCGGDGGPAAPASDTADVQTDAGADVDAISDAGPDADRDTDRDSDQDADASDGDPDAPTDAAADVSLDGSGDVGPIDVPFAPTPVATPAVDTPFLQEFNHTTPEVDPRIGPLVDVVLAPTSHGDWPAAIQVTPRGLVRAVEPAFVEVVPVVEPTAAPLLGAGTAGDLLVAASSEAAYRVGPDAAVAPIALPEGTVVRRVVDGRTGVWLLTDAGPVRVRADGVDLPASGMRALALAEDDRGVVVAGEGTLARWSDPASIGVGLPVWELVNAADPGYEALVLDVALPRALDVVAFHRDGAWGLVEREAGAELVVVDLFAPDRVPLRGAVEAVRTGDGGFVAVGPEGAWRIMDRGDGPEWRVYPAERWLPHQDVRGVATPASDALSELFFATAGGLARVTAQYMTLEQKMAYFVDRVVARHDRDGAVADSRLTVRGDLSTNIPWDSDNDGGWTCYWILAECSRWLETGAEDARANFDRSLDRMLSLQTLTGTEHFLARAVIRREGCRLDDCDDPDDGEWFLSPDAEWWVKGNTSNDEVISHMFMMGPAYDWCATEDQRAAIRQHVTRIVGGIIDNGWMLVDVDGEVTRYGQFDPGYVNVSIAGRTSDGGRRSVAALGMAALAYHLSGDPRFLEARQALIDEHGYADNAVRSAEYPLFGGQYSGDNHELAMQAWMALLRYEPDPLLRERWFDGWRRTWAVLEVQQGAMWDVAHHMLGGDAAPVEHIVRWLRLAPMDFVRWSIANGHRRDLVPPPPHYEQRGRMRSDGRPIPYDERANDRWNTDQYRIDRGHGGWVEMDGADVLAPYWLARHFGLVVPL